MNSTTAPTERDIDEILQDVWDAGYLDSDAVVINKKHFKQFKDVTIDQAKQAIEAHYRQKFEKLIGEDEDAMSVRKYKSKLRIYYRNQFRTQLRAKLKEELS